MEQRLKYSLKFASWVTLFFLPLSMVLDPYIIPVFPIIGAMVFALGFIMGEIVCIARGVSLRKSQSKKSTIISGAVIIILLFLVGTFIYIRYEQNVHYWDWYGKTKN